MEPHHFTIEEGRGFSVRGVSPRALESALGSAAYKLGDGFLKNFGVDSTGTIGPTGSTTQQLEFAMEVTVTFIDALLREAIVEPEYRADLTQIPPILRVTAALVVLALSEDRMTLQEAFARMITLAARRFEFNVAPPAGSA